MSNLTPFGKPVKINNPEIIAHLKKMPQAEREQLANSVLAASELMSPSEKKELIDTLSAALTEETAISAAAAKKKKVINSLAAAKSGSLGEKNALGLIEGELRRGNCPPIDVLAFKQPHEINEILAKSSMPTDKRFAVKNYLVHLGAI
jgi:hypothetical protein